MPIDIRAQTAKYYDLNPNIPNDIPFYKERIVSPDTQVLELGCGTGRVLLPLSSSCQYIHGIDASAAMSAVCRRLAEAGVPATKASVQIGDITNFALDRRFDLIIAPFRVLQNIETDAEVDGLFQCIQCHLAPGGSCILNVFHPYMDAETLRREWCTDKEILAWEVTVGGERVTCHDRRSRLDRDNLILYPELIYRQYQGGTLVDETVLHIAMRCYYPDGFQQLIVDHGFRIINCWGGYSGEPYGAGSELVVQFTHDG